MRIYLSTNGKEDGPFTITEVKEKIYKGEIIESHTIGRAENGEHWIPLQTLLASANSELTTGREKPKDISTPSVTKEAQNSRKSLKAIFAFTLMIFGSFTFPFGIILIIASLVLGFFALRDIKKSNRSLSGRGYITASRVILYVILLIMASPYIISFIKLKVTSVKSRVNHAEKSNSYIDKSIPTRKIESKKSFNVKEIFNKCSPLIVSVESFDKCGFRTKTGSGVILGPSKECFATALNNNTIGTDIITNFHVIDNSNLVIVKTKDGKIRYAQIIAFDRKIDLALIRIKGSFVDKETAITESVGIGDDTVAIGNPMGIEQSLSTGIVSHLPDNKKLIVQTTAPISHGSSGGGLFDENGELIGITTAMVESGQNLNFAIWLKGELLNAVQNVRNYKGHVWNNVQASWLKVPYAFGKYPFERIVKESSNASILDPDEDFLTIRRPQSSFKTEEEIKKYVEDNSIDPEFTKYSTSKRNILKTVSRFEDVSRGILEESKENTDISLKKYEEVQDYKNKTLLPSISDFYSEFPYDESIAAMYVKYVQDPTIKENLLKSCYERWPYSIGQSDAQWLYQYLQLLISLGKVQKAHDVFSDYVDYISVQPIKCNSDDAETNEIVNLFNGDAETSRTYIINQSLKQYIDKFPQSIKGISFKDIKERFNQNISNS